MVKMRKAWQYDADAASVAAGFECPEPSKAQQASKDEADINTLVRRFGITGQLPIVERPPTFEDFTEVVSDYQTAQNLLIAADRAFMQLPSKVRLRFENDPAAFVAFCEDEKNLDELREMGLAIQKKMENNDPGPVENVGEKNGE